MKRGRVFAARFVAVGLALGCAAMAEAQGLSRAASAMNNFKSQLMTIIPIVAVIALVLLGIGYAARFVHKESFWHWAVGIIIVGSATEIVTMLLG